MKHAAADRIRCIGAEPLHSPGFRWSFYGHADVDVVVSAAATTGFLVLCLGIIAWIFKTGYKLKS